MKYLIFILLSINVYSQTKIDTTTTISASDFSGDISTLNTIGETSIELYTTEEYRESFLRYMKSHHAYTLSLYFKSLKNIVVGYTFKWNISKNDTSETYSAKSYYYFWAKDYASVDNFNWIFNSYSTEEEMLNCLNNSKCANDVLHDLNYLQYEEVEPILAKEKPSLEGYLKWLTN